MQLDKSRIRSEEQVTASLVINETTAHLENPRELSEKLLQTTRQFSKKDDYKIHKKTFHLIKWGETPNTLLEHF